MRNGDLVHDTSRCWRWRLSDWGVEKRRQKIFSTFLFSIFNSLHLFNLLFCYLLAAQTSTHSHPSRRLVAANKKKSFFFFCHFPQVKKIFFPFTHFAAGLCARLSSLFSISRSHQFSSSNGERERETRWENDGEKVWKENENRLKILPLFCISNWFSLFSRRFCWWKFISFSFWVQYTQRERRRQSGKLIRN